MNTALDPAALLLRVFRQHRAKLSVEVVGLRQRIAALDSTIATAERLQHDTEERGRAAA